MVRKISIGLWFMFPELFIAMLLASPVAARDQSIEPAASAGDSDVCSYIKDMKGMADGNAAKQQVSVLEQRLQLACEKITWAVLTEREPAASSAWRESVPKRRALIEKAVTILRKHAVDPKALEDSPENAAALAANADLSRLPGYSAGEPLNAQSIAAWLPPEADGAKQVYTMWLVVQNRRLRGEKWGQDQPQKDPMTPERRKQIDDTLAANKVRLKKMERIEDPGEFKSFIEGSVMGQGEARTGVDASASLRPGNPSDEAADNRSLKVPQSMRGVDRKSVPMPSPPQDPPPTPTGTEQYKGSGLIGKALGFGGAAVAGAMVLWRRKRDEQELDDARGEVAAEDRAHAVAKGEIVELPALTSDPVGFAADRVLRAKMFVQEHPYVSPGVGLGALALAGYLALPAMIAGGGGELVFATAGKAALGAAPAATVTLPQVGAAVAGGAVVLMAVDAKDNKDGNGGGSDEKATKKAPVPESVDGKRVINPSKSKSPIWKELENYRNGIKRSRHGSQTRYYKWDNLHKDIEMYDAKGRHMGSVDPRTGLRYKPSVPGRTIASQL